MATKQQAASALQRLQQLHVQKSPSLNLNDQQRFALRSAIETAVAQNGAGNYGVAVRCANRAADILNGRS